MKPTLLRFLAVLALVAGTVSTHAAPATIGNKNLANEKIDAATLKAVFLGKKVSWDSAGRVTLAVLKGDLAEEFLKATVDMNASTFTNHWRRLSMTGGGTAPKFFEKADELRRFVAETPGAIGFIDPASVDGSVIPISGS
jgi:ABC-type phosphate transport system substrate-binding protein